MCLGLFINVCKYLQTPQTGRKFTISGNLRMLKWRNSSLLIIGPKPRKCPHDDDCLQHSSIILLSLPQREEPSCCPLDILCLPPQRFNQIFLAFVHAPDLGLFCNQYFFKVLSSSESCFVLDNGQLVLYIIKDISNNLLMNILRLSETNISTMLGRFILSFRVLHLIEILPMPWKDP